MSGDSLEENFLEFDRNLNDLLNQEERKDKERATRNGESHIEEWIKQTSKDAVPPDVLLGGTDGPPRDIASPTFTDNSLNYSQTVSWFSDTHYNVPVFIL